jgi:outer membrane protein
VHTKSFHGIITAICVFAFAMQTQLSAQSTKTLNLKDAVNLALQNNHLLNIREYQVDEKEEKVKENKIKFLPTIAVGGSYQYNTNLPSITIDQGRFGSLPYGGVLYPLPLYDEVIEVGEHNVYNTGVTFYQPVSQLGKINAGVQFSKTELRIAQTEQVQAVFEIKQAVEKLYFGLLILGKQMDEAEIRIKLAESKLNEAENAHKAGKAIESGIFGLSAALADEEQKLLRLKIDYDDFRADLIQLTGLNTDEVLELLPVPDKDITEDLPPIDTSLWESVAGNNDLKLAMLNKTKAEYSIKASKFSYLPDLGILGGYTYQEGSDIYPRNNAYIGASLKWNLQDILANMSIHQQRVFIRKQAEENLANTREQLSRDIYKTYRKLRQSDELIKVAGKVVKFRSEELKIQIDKSTAGLNLESDLLSAKAAMAKAEADLFSAQLNYRIVLSELKSLTGKF